MPLQPITTCSRRSSRRSGGSSSAAARATNGRHRQHPGHPQGHDAAAHRGGREHEPSGVAALDPVDDARELQPDEQEQQRVEQERHDLPERQRLQTRRRAADRLRAPLDDEAGGDRAEDARHAGLVGQDVGGIGGQQRDRDLHVRVVGVPSGERGEPADGRPDRGAAQRDHHELEQAVAQRKGPGPDDADGDRVGGQARAVVDQRLALEQGLDPPRSAEPAHHCGRRDGVGRPQHGTEDERDRPRQSRDEVSDQRDRAGSGEHQADGQRTERQRVAAQLGAVGQERGRIQQRR